MQKCQDQRCKFNQKKKLKRESILKESIKNLILIKSKSFTDTSLLINECAPEHLILLDEDFARYLPTIKNAGSIFCGSLSPESFGDMLLVQIMSSQQTEKQKLLQA